MLAFQQKPLFLTTLLALIITSFFWFGSRYPDLDEKALMGNETQLAAIGFDTIVDVPSNASLAIQIPYNTLNWLYTNWRGMVFGLLMGAVLLTLLPLIGRYNFKSRWANSLMGVVVGSPLGVCVNCAAPIAQGLFAAGGRTEMALATLFSSPTLNVIVLTMVFALFPTYMAVTKIGLTILFIIVGLPLITQFLPFPETANLNTNTSSQKKWFEIPINEASLIDLPNTWGQAVLWVVKYFAQNLWYIVRITVPLMVLAGLLGATLVTILPLETLAGVLPKNGGLMILLSMVGLALIGLFLPVPMAFDVIVTAVLLQAGLPVGYAMVLLFTLGIFSVYPFFLIWQTMSKVGAIGLFLILAGVGVAGGIGAREYHQWDFVRQQQLIVERFGEHSQAPPKPDIDRGQQGHPQAELVPLLQQSRLPLQPVVEADNLSVSQVPFGPRSDQSETYFSRIEGNQLGITEHDNFSTQKLSFRLAKLRGIAAGDIHNDGWSDLVITSDIGLGLYANVQGTGYQQQRLNLPQINTLYIANAALVDMNNDGWLDLYLSTFSEGNYLIYNQQGSFTKDNLQLVPNMPDAILTNASAFGDIDQNGELDIILGNATFGNVGRQASLDMARNAWLKQVDQQFELEPLPAIAGETLTTLLTDLNDDGWLDLVVGNEFRAPDFYYLNDGRGGFEMVTKGDGLIPHTGSTTMSLISTDVNNDLKSEIFVAQKAWERGAVAPQLPEVICSDISDDTMRAHCITMLELRDTTMQARSRDLFECLQLETTEQQNSCLALNLYWDGVAKKDKRECELLTKGWPVLADQCALHAEAVTEPTAPQLAAEIPQVVKRNVLLVQDETGSYQDQADDYGLTYGGWAWNAKFADFDQDGWQDLFIVTGDLTVQGRHSNYLFHNREGTGFEDITTEGGLHSYLDTLAYTYTDMDNDSDLDIVTVPAAGPIAVYRNNTQSGQAIAFELRDEQGNHFGIGSTITIYYGTDQHQMREIQASGGFLSFDAPIAHFGLGEVETIDRIEIQWSTGEVSELNEPLPAGSRYIITRKE